MCLGGYAAAASAAAAAGTHDVVLGLVALDVVRDLDREDVVAPDRRRQVVPIFGSTAGVSVPAQMWTPTWCPTGASAAPSTGQYSV